MAAVLRARWFWLALGVVAADQLAKAAVQRYVEFGAARAIIPGFASLVHARNPGVAFGMLAGVDSAWVQGLLIAFALAAMSALTWLLASGRAGAGASAAGLALILGGAAGNFLDRVRQGSVVDFLDLHLGAYHWPAFNVADAAITIGAALVIFDQFFGRRRPEPR